MYALKATKAKQRQAKLGKRLPVEHRRKIGDSIKAWWVRSNATPLGPP